MFVILYCFIYGGVWMTEQNKPDKLFDNMYEAIEYCLSSGYGLIDQGHIANYKMKNIVTKELSRDVVTLLGCIDDSGFVEAVLAYEDVSLIKDMGIFNLSFFISSEILNGKQSLYDYDANEIIKVYIRVFYGNEAEEKYDNVLSENIDDVKDRSMKAAKKFSILWKIIIILLFIIVIFIGFKFSILMAVITFFVFGQICSIAKLFFLKNKKYVIKNAIKSFF